MQLQNPFSGIQSPRCAAVAIERSGRSLPQVGLIANRSHSAIQPQEFKIFLTHSPRSLTRILLQVASIARPTSAFRSNCYRGAVLPNVNGEGDLPPGVHLTDWKEFQARFGRSSSRRVWLFGRLQALVELANANGKLRRVFIWGSFVTAKPAPKDLDILLIMDESFEVDFLPPPARAVFDSVWAKLLFESDVFWARASIGSEMLDLWLETYQTSRSFRKRGIVELELP